MGFAGKQPTNASRFDPATQAEWAALPMPFRECGEIAGLRLSIALSEALREASDLLFSEGTQALTRVEREFMLDAAEFARARRETLVEDFLRHFEQRYARACQYKPTLMSGYRIDFDASQLKVIKHDLLDDSLDPGMIAEAIQNASWGYLHDLTRCFALLLGADALNPNDIPLSPRLIEAAISDATRDQLWRHDAKYRLIRSLRRYLPERVGQLYRDLAEHLDPMVRRVGEDAAEPMAAYGREEPESQVDTLSQPTISTIEADLDRIDIALSDDVVEMALAVARGELARREIESPPLPAGDLAISLPEDLPCLPDVVATGSVEAEVQPKAQALSPSEDAQSGPARADSLLATLESGTWLEFQEEDGSVRALKLAWISPRKSLYLLTNRRGERARSMVAEDLSTALAEGRVRIVMPRESKPASRAAPDLLTKKTA